MRLLTVMPIVTGLLTTSASAQMLMKTEPPRGQLKTGQTVLVDNGKCGPGKVLQVTGGYFTGGRSSVTSNAGGARKYECVARPK
jgi:hypothetical protein